MIILPKQENDKKVIVESQPKASYLYHPKIQPAHKVGNSIQLLKRQYPDTRIGFTNGKFRSLTPAHVVFLNLCKTRCNILIVALNSDYSLRLLKEKSLFEDKERAFLIANIDVVNFVTFFDEDNPYKVISEISPDVVFKGDDYEHKDVVCANRPVEIIKIPSMPEHLSDLEQASIEKNPDFQYFKVNI